VLFVGRLSRQKGLHLLLRAWQHAPLSGSRLILVGGTSTVAPMGLAEVDSAVIVRPWTADIVSYYRAVDAFVLPSLVEGMSNALLEAMACGLACVATRVGAAEDMIDSGRTGLLIDPGMFAT